MEKNEVFTKLVDKHHSPLVIRKYTHWGFPIYVGLITDNDLSNLDEIVTGFIKENIKSWAENLQTLRNFAGGLTEYLNTVYEKTEGVAIIFYVDKCMISSLYGDFMTHHACRTEFFSLLHMTTSV